MRLLDKARGLLTLEDLGMAEVERAKLDALIRRPHGMILLTGPTGSGKSTTLYAILQALARPEVNIITVEDPIEYDIPGVGQVQENEKAGVTFASALRSILRQDPDIIMIGEMRDFETAHIGVQSSLTGHLVLSTLHTNDSISAVSRLVDMGIEPYLIAGSLLGVIAQRLVRKICPKCRTEAPAPATMRKHGVKTVFSGIGCEYCNGTGYRGRFGLYEQFDVTPEAADAISRKGSLSELRRIAKDAGMRSLLELGVASVAAGDTTPEEMMRVVGEV
jgi:type II secretory ATPase GspE/PulE/Tfp pilus assembly ATPase PilB-like protein